LNSSLSVSPSVTTTYTLTVTGTGGTITKQVTITVNSAPPTATFTASPTTITAGQSATLSWTTTNATSVSINNGIGSVALNSSLSVSPSVTTTYTLTVTGSGGTITQQVTIIVNPAPPTATFTASPTTITAGQSATLSWTTTNATSASINNGIGSVALNSSLSVNPSATTTYTLTVTGSGGTITQQVTITVNSAPPSAQLSIGTFTASPGGLVQIPVQFNPESFNISALQFNLTLPAGISAASATAGPAATAAGKSVQTGQSGTTFGVIIFGINTNTISSGDVADISLQLTSSASGTLPLNLSNLVASDPVGNSIPLTGTNGSIIVSGAAALATPSLQMADVLPVDGSATVDYTGTTPVTFQWSITPQSSASAALATPALVQPDSVRTLSTSGNLLSLAPLDLTPGRYLFAVEAVDALGNHSAPAQQVVTLVPSTAGTVRVFPNPWRADRPTSFIKFDSLTVESTVKIFTVSGRWVRTVTSSNGVATWDLKTDNGDWAASGLYIYLVTDNQGGKIHGELAIIR